MKEESYLSLAACRLCIPIDQLWDYREGRDGITFRTCDGYRHRFSFNELESEQTGLLTHQVGSAALRVCDSPGAGMVQN